MIATLDYAISSLRRAAESGYSWLVSPAGAAALVAEVERLRYIEADAADLARFAAEKATQKERAAVVAWLRGEPERLVACDGHRHADGKPCFVLSPMPADELADDIERGGHRREENP